MNRENDLVQPSDAVLSAADYRDQLKQGHDDISALMLRAVSLANEARSQQPTFTASATSDLFTEIKQWAQQIRICLDKSVEAGIKISALASRSKKQLDGLLSEVISVVDSQLELLKDTRHFTEPQGVGFESLPLSKLMNRIFDCGQPKFGELVRRGAIAITEDEVSQDPHSVIANALWLADVVAQQLTNAVAARTNSGAEPKDKTAFGLDPAIMTVHLVVDRRHIRKQISVNGMPWTYDFPEGALKIAIVDACGGVKKGSMHLLNDVDPETGMQKIFSLGASSKRVGGLGLALARYIAAKHGGFVEAQNVTPNGIAGLELCLVLPLSRKQ